MLEKMQSDVTKNPGTLPIDEADPDQLEAMGMSRGGGIAIQGTKFSGVK